MGLWPFGRKNSEEPTAEALTGTQEVLSLLAPDEIQELGVLPPEAVVGVFVGEPAGLETFRPNPRFAAFMHEVIAAAETDAELQAAAQDQGEGSVLVIDLRTPEGPQGEVPPEDIIGGFQVQAGRIVAGSYRGNPSHRVLTANGMVCLPASLRAAFVRSLASRGAAEAPQR